MWRRGGKGREGEGREGEDQARFFMWMSNLRGSINRKLKTTTINMVNSLNLCFRYFCIWRFDFFPSRSPVSPGRQGRWSPWIQWRSGTLRPGECEGVGLSVLLWDQTLGLLYRPRTVGVIGCCLETQLIRTLIPCIQWESGALRCWRREVCGEWGRTRLCSLPPLPSLRGGARGTLGPPLWLRRTHQL